MSVEQPRAWLLDTSVVVDLDDPRVLAALPEETAISVVTLAELAVGPLATEDLAVRAQRQRHLQEIEDLFDPVPVDAGPLGPSGRSRRLFGGRGVRRGGGSSTSSSPPWPARRGCRSRRAAPATSPARRDSSTSGRSDPGERATLARAHRRRTAQEEPWPASSST